LGFASTEKWYKAVPRMRIFGSYLLLAAGICYGEPAVPSANTVLDQANCSDRAFDQASGRCDKSGASRPPAPKPPQPPVPVPTSKFDLPIGRELAGVPE